MVLSSAGWLVVVGIKSNLCIRSLYKRKAFWELSSVRTPSRCPCFGCLVWRKFFAHSPSVWPSPWWHEFCGMLSPLTEDRLLFSDLELRLGYSKKPFILSDLTLNSILPFGYPVELCLCHCALGVSVMVLSPTL